MARQTKKIRKAFEISKKHLILGGGVLFSLGLFLFAYSLIYQDRILPNVRVAGVKVGGLSLEGAQEKIAASVASGPTEILIEGPGEKRETVTTKKFDVAYDTVKSAELAFVFGRQGSPGKRIFERLKSLVVATKLAASFFYDEGALSSFQNAFAGSVEDPEKDAQIEFSDDVLSVTSEKSGKRLPDFEPSAGILYRFGHLDAKPLVLSLHDVVPTVTRDKAETVKEEVGRMVKEPLVLIWEKKSFKWDHSTLLSFIELASSRDLARPVIVIVNEAKVRAAADAIAGNIDQPAVDAKLTISGGKASVFTASHSGFTLDRDKAVSDIVSTIEARRTDSDGKQISLSVKETLPAVRTETINDLGIAELIGAGTTSFTGSPQNRIHNITVGANSFNGILIKPGDTFSTIAALGNIDESTGYKPELVIKEDRLKPELGGGLCQVSTTLFRAALSAGLPIIERKNHSFRVRYYEPPIGMDATIYDPAPDLKFTNDTPGYILIQTKVVGTKITFEFYGTSDGRVATTSTPRSYGFTSPGDPVYIEDPSLAPGETKQIEKAVPGASADFTYTVKRGGKIIYQKTFTSKYVAWKAKYLVGPAASTPPPEEPAPPAPATE
jgi:vancomycin resistance protein YoaR